MLTDPTTKQNSTRQIFRTDTILGEAGGGFVTQGVLHTNFSINTPFSYTLVVHTYTHFMQKFEPYFLNFKLTRTLI